jgi:hypothetical protein
MKADESAKRKDAEEWRDEVERAIENAKRSAWDRKFRREWYKAMARKRWSRARRERWLRVRKAAHAWR